MVQGEAFAHITVLVPLILGWDEHWKDARAELTAHVLHDFTVGSTDVDTALSSEVCAEDTIIVAISAPPSLPLVLLLFPHAFDDLRELCVTGSVIDFSIKGELGSFESLNNDRYPRFRATCHFWSVIKQLVLQSGQ